MKKKEKLNQLTLFTEQGRDYVIEERPIFEAAIEKNLEEYFSKSGEVSSKGKSKVARKIEYALLSKLQKKTNSVDRKILVEEAKKNVKEKLIKLKLIKENKLLLETEMYKIALIDEIRNVLKDKISNKFYFTKEEILRISGQTTNNIKYLESILNNMKSSCSYIVKEIKLDENFQNKIVETTKIDFFSSFGTAVINQNATINDSNIFSSTEKIDFCNLKPLDKVLIEVHSSFLPYMVAPHKNDFTQGFIILLNDIINSFELEHTLQLYKLIEGSKEIWKNKSYTFQELQSKFETKYGIKKKRNNKTGEILKNKMGQPLYEVEKNGDFKYEENYHIHFKYFKRDILLPSIAEINKKTDFNIRLVEIRKGGSLLFKYSASINELISQGILHEKKDCIISGGMKSKIQFIQFIISEKKKRNNNNTKYNNSGYYLTLRSFFNRRKNKNLEQISDFEAFSKKINKELEENFENNLIAQELGIISYEELIKIVKLNFNSILKIKEILNLDIIEFSTLYFCEKYLTVFDKSSNLNNGLYSRLGDDAIEALEKMYEIYPNFEDEINKNYIQLSIEDFLPFEFFHNKRFIKVNHKNFDSLRLDIDKSIKNGYKKNFKAFSALSVKKEFYKRFFK